MAAVEVDPISFRSNLLAWYQAGRRDLPLARRPRPVGRMGLEVMLQQTRVETVRPRFSAFLAAFPTPAALAAAPEETVLAHWSGLGYYARARRLRHGASVVADRPGGAFPRDPAAARIIPRGWTVYRRGRPLSISFDLPYAVVDGNVARVLARLHRLEPPHDRPGAHTRRLAQELPRPDPSRRPQPGHDGTGRPCLPPRPTRSAPQPARAAGVALWRSTARPTPQDDPALPGETLAARTGGKCRPRSSSSAIASAGSSSKGATGSSSRVLWLPVIRPGRWMYGGD